VSADEYEIKDNIQFPGLEGIVHRCLKEKLPNYEVNWHRSILYQVVVDENLRFQPSDPTMPTRGSGAFETDILVARSQEPRIPLVAVEIKESLTTDNLLTATAKAAKHKNVYPYLRCGIAFFWEKNLLIPGRFFTHNSAFDFAISLKEPDGNHLPDCDKLADVVRRQIEVSEYLIELMNGSKRVQTYESCVKVD
jgi:hypothetical protein